MKYQILLSLFMVFFTVSATNSHAQVLKKIKDRVKETAENKVVDKAGNATSESMDKAEESLKKNKTDKKEKEATGADRNSSEKAIEPTTDTVQPSNENTAVIAYKNYDFVPGEKVIYYYDMEGEKDAEIPGRMLINDGTVEIQSFNNEKVLFVPRDANVSMIPYIDSDSYLPEQFTIEFEILTNEETSGLPAIELYFRTPDRADDAWSVTGRYFIRIEGINNAGASVTFAQEATDGFRGSPVKLPEDLMPSGSNNWRKVAVYVNKNIGKLYIDHFRATVVNRIMKGAGMITFEVITQDQPVLIKNIRLAAGGSDAYNKVMSEGKFIAHGIQFDVNKSVLKPASMGAINEVFSMLQKYPDLKFEIGGHTDSDGAKELNDRLSAARAEAVKNQLVQMGINANRLTAKGYGSSQHITDNSSPEGKANNRRVEFKKIN